MPAILRRKRGRVKGNGKRFWLQIATEFTEKSFSDNKLCQKPAWNSGLASALARGVRKSTTSVRSGGLIPKRSNDIPSSLILVRRFSRRRNLPNRHPNLHKRIYLYISIVLILSKYNDTYALNVLPQIPVRRWASESVS